MTSTETAIETWVPETASGRISRSEPSVPPIGEETPYYFVSGELSPATQQLLEHARRQLSDAELLFAKENNSLETTDKWYGNRPTVEGASFRLHTKDENGIAQTIEVPNLNEVGWSQEPNKELSEARIPPNGRFEALSLVLHLRYNTRAPKIGETLIPTNMITMPRTVETRDRVFADELAIWTTIENGPNVDEAAEVLMRAYHSMPEPEAAAVLAEEMVETRNIQEMRGVLDETINGGRSQNQTRDRTAPADDQPATEPKRCSQCRVTNAHYRILTDFIRFDGTHPPRKTFHACRRCLPTVRRLLEAVGFHMGEGKNPGTTWDALIERLENRDTYGSNKNKPTRRHAIKTSKSPARPTDTEIFEPGPAEKTGPPEPTIGVGTRTPMRHRMTRLERDLVIMDAEWLGGSPYTAAIVSLALQRLHPDGTGYKTSYSVYPGQPIDPASAKIHGFTDEIVKNLPLFDHYAAQILEDVENADVGGYSTRNDVGIVERTLAECQLSWNLENVKIVDGIRIWQVNEPRGLINAHERFVGPIPDTVSAHDAAGDVEMTVKIIETLAGDLSAAEIHDLTDPKQVDAAGKFILRDDGEIMLNFGPHRDKKAKDFPTFLIWMIEKDFPPSTKAIAQKLLDEAVETPPPNKEETASVDEDGKIPF